MKKDKDIIGLALRIFKSGSLTEKEAVDSIINTYKNSRMFNINNFICGFLLGSALMYILLSYII